MPVPANVSFARLTDPALRSIGAKLAAGVRLTAADGLPLFGTPDLLGVGPLATAATAPLLCPGNQVSAMRSDVGYPV